MFIPVDIKWIAESIIKLISFIIWPAVIIYIVHKFALEIRQVLNKGKKFSAGYFSIEVEQQKSAEMNRPMYKELSGEVKKLKNVQELLLEIHSETARDRNVYKLFYNFEKTYRIILGSQLQMLVFLQSNKNLPRAVLEALHGRTIWRDTYPFDDYMGFLEAFQLVTFNRSDNTYSLTEIGNIFLAYLKANNIPLDKPN